MSNSYQFKSLTKMLDDHRPDMPTCKETALKDSVDSVLMKQCPTVPGKTYLEVLVMRKLDYSIEHPESVSLGDIAKITAPRKEKVEIDAGNGLLDVFARFSEKPQEVVDVEEKE